MLKGAGLMALVSTAGFTVVVLGTIGAICVQTPLPVMRHALKILPWVMRPPVLQPEILLKKMLDSLPAPRANLSKYAPRIQTIQIDPEKIGLLIGPGGKTIRRITETTGAQVDIAEDDSGKVYIYSNNADAMNRAIEEIDSLCGGGSQIEVGKLYHGRVTGLKEFGAFIECMPGKEGLCHISELADFRVRRTEDVVKMGDMVWVKCVGIDERTGKVRLSRRAAVKEMEEKKPAEAPAASPA